MRDVRAAAVDDPQLRALPASPRLQHRLMSAMVVGALGLWGCSSSGPTGPSPSTGPSASTGPGVVSLEVECQPTLAIGERRGCLAVARRSDGSMPLVSPVASWSSSRPDIVAVDAIGTARGVAPGRSVVTVAYGGHQASAEVTVLPGDSLKLTAVIEQGTFEPDSSVMMAVTGFYSVQSEDSGFLRLLITDQAGNVLLMGPGTVLPRGGDSFLASAHFRVPVKGTVLCRVVRLEVGRVVIDEPRLTDPQFPKYCLPVRR